MTDTDKERRLRFLAALEEGEALWGLDRFSRWLKRMDATRLPTSPLSRHLTWQARAGTIALFAFTAAFLALYLLGDSLALSFSLALFLAVASFLFQANWYWQLPEVAHGGTLGSLLWTVVLGLAIAALVLAGLFLVPW